MVSPRKIRIMISSRCMDPITLDKEKRTFSDVRLELKKQLEAETLLGSIIFDVWINEDGVAADGTEDSWTKCLKQAVLEKRTD